VRLKAVEGIVVDLTDSLSGQAEIFPQLAARFRPRMDFEKDHLVSIAQQLSGEVTQLDDIVEGMELVLGSPKRFGIDIEEGGVNVLTVATGRRGCVARNELEVVTLAAAGLLECIFGLVASDRHRQTLPAVTQIVW
jgi:hypothetical protein